MSTSIAEIDAKLKYLVESQLDEIRIGMFQVQFCFFTVSNGAFISINEDFSFYVDGYGNGSFFISHAGRNLGNSSSNFGMLQGATCSDASISESEFTISFGGSGRIKLDMVKSVGESLHVTYAGSKKGSIEFFAAI